MTPSILACNKRVEGVDFRHHLMPHLMRGEGIRILITSKLTLILICLYSHNALWGVIGSYISLTRSFASQLWFNQPFPLNSSQRVQLMLCLYFQTLRVSSIRFQLQLFGEMCKAYCVTQFADLCSIFVWLPFVLCVFFRGGNIGACVNFVQGSSRFVLWRSTGSNQN